MMPVVKRGIKGESEEQVVSSLETATMAKIGPRTPSDVLSGRQLHIESRIFIELRRIALFPLFL